jgi:stalled ribosome rescue protein Dom34
MNTYVVWIEMNQAKIFNVSRSEPSLTVLNRREIKHHTSRDPKNHKDCEKFFHLISETISNADEILLMGPGLAKKHFKSHLEHHHHKNLAKVVIGEITLDIMSDEQLLAHARDYFKEYAVYGAAALPA